MPAICYRPVTCGSIRVLINEGEPSAHRAVPPHPPAPRSADRGSYPPGTPAHPQTSGQSAPGRSGQPGGGAAMPEPTTSVPASLPPRADSIRLTGVQVAERVNVSASTWRSYVAPGQAPAADGRFDARTPWWHSSTVDQWQASRPRRRSCAARRAVHRTASHRRVPRGRRAGAWTAAPSSRSATAAPTTVPSWRARSA
jgi:hypothetical protein